MPNTYGRRPHTRDPRDYLARATVPYTGAYVTLEGGMPAVWDQGQLGACVAFGSCAAYVYAAIKAGYPYRDPAELFVYYAARERAGYPLDQDTGLEIRDGIHSLAKDGVAPKEDWPYDVARFAQRPPGQAYRDAAANEAVAYGAVAPGDVDAMIASGWPVVIGFDVYESFESVAANGVMPVPTKGERQVGGHCVVLCSTLKDGSQIPGGAPGVGYRRARNSWGNSWGDGGYFWYPDPAMSHASDFWQVTTVSAPVPPAPGPVPDDATTQFLDACATFRGVLGPFVRSSGWCAKRVRRAGATWLTAEQTWRDAVEGGGS